MNIMYDQDFGYRTAQHIFESFVVYIMTLVKQEQNDLDV